MNNNLEDRSDRIETDKRTIDALISHGADLDKQHLIDFYFVGPTEKIEKLKPMLEKEGYTVNNDKPEEETLLVQKNIRLEQMKSHIITESLESMANEFGVKFDGWGTVAKK